MKFKKVVKFKYRLTDGRYPQCDPRPMSVPIGMERPESLQEKLKRLVRDEVLQSKLKDGGVETFEEADDFNISDDPIDPHTPYEEDFDPKGMTAREQEVRHGAVADLPEARWQKARRLLDGHKPRRRASDRVRRSEDKKCGRRIKNEVS